MSNLSVSEPAPPNRLNRLVGKTNGMPKLLGSWLLNFGIRRTVKLVGTAKLDCVHLDTQVAVFKIENRKKVQNHIGSVHAAAMALLAETATGMVVGMNLPDDKIPLIKSMRVDYLKRATGAMTAKATLDPEQRALILEQDKGEVTVAVSVTDATGIAPIECQMVWAWIPKQRR